MTQRHWRGHLLRDDGAADHRVTSFELFFDLVYVFAITQLSHLLLGHLDLRGALQAALLLLAVWVAWIYTAWTTNWFDPNQPPVRVMLITLMVAAYGLFDEAHQYFVPGRDASLADLAADTAGGFFAAVIFYHKSF